MARQFLNGLRLLSASSDPTGSGVGDTYYNSSSGKVRIYDGSAWGDVGGGSITSSSQVAVGRLASDQTIPTTADTVISFVDDVDPNNWWDAGTKKFTPNVAGYYNVTLNVWWSGVAAVNNQFNCQVRKNGNTVALYQNPINGGTGSGISQGGSKVVYLNGSTDYLDFTAYNGNASSVTIQYGGNTSGQGCNFSATLMTAGAGPTGATGATGPAGVVAATAPVTYDSGTQTVGLSIGDGLTTSANALTVSGVSVAQGGTGAATLTGVVVGNGASAMTAVSTTQSGRFLSWTGSVYQFAQISLNSGSPSISGILSVGSGGTGLNTLAVGDLIYASSTTAFSRRAAVAAGSALISAGTNTAPVWGQIGLTTHVTGTLPLGNGGTGGTTAATARTSLGAAASGANGDITSLTALTGGTITSGAAVNSSLFDTTTTGSVSIAGALTTGSISIAGAQTTGTTSIANLGTASSAVYIATNSTGAGVTGVTLTQGASSGQSTATVSSATGIAVGMEVSTSIFPAGTTVTAINGTTLTFSNTNTSAGTGVTAVFGWTKTIGIGTSSSGAMFSYVNIGTRGAVTIPAQYVLTSSGFYNASLTGRSAVVTGSPYQLGGAPASSVRYKTDITPYMWDKDQVLSLETKKFRYIKDVEAMGDEAPWHYGAIAEDAAAAGLDYLVDKDEEGRPDYIFWSERGVQVLYSIVQQLNEENKALKARLDAAGL